MTGEKEMERVERCGEVERGGTGWKSGEGERRYMRDIHTEGVKRCGEGG